MLKVYANNTAMVSDLAAMAQNVRRYVGRVFDGSIGVSGGWVPNVNPVEIADRAEYRQALREGDLRAADKETADLVGVTFTQI